LILRIAQFVSVETANLYNGTNARGAPARARLRHSPLMALGGA